MYVIPFIVSAGIYIAHIIKGGKQKLNTYKSISEKKEEGQEKKVL